MSFSDGETSPTAPFSGDETGDIFNAPDMVLHSPTTSERIVDTQSGFLVVVRHHEGRQALSVRRRVGTPPMSHVQLTPDESLQLSHILESNALSEQLPTNFPVSSENWLKVTDLKNLVGNAEVSLEPDKALISSGRLWYVFGGVLLLVLCLGGLTGFFVSNFPNLKVTRAAVALVSPFESAKVDRFARRFVSDMLDFNPATYKVSQVRAMAAMSPELVERYWTETNFPLSKQDLNTLSQGTTIMITRISQSVPGTRELQVDIFGQVTNAGSKLGSPLHLKLKLSAEGSGELKVIEQKDVTAHAG